MIRNFCHLAIGHPKKSELNEQSEEEDLVLANPVLDVNKKTILCLPGGGIESYRYLYRVTPVIRELIPKESDCDIVVAYYPKINVEEREDNRFKHFISHGGMGDDFIVENPKTYFKYFDKAFRSYLFDETGALLPDDKIAHNLSNLLLFSNCHGSTITAEFVSYLKEKGVSDKARHSLKIINFANRGMFHQGETAQVLNINSQLDGFVPDSYIRSDHILSPIFRGVSFIAQKINYSSNVKASPFAKPYLFLESDNLITLAPPSMKESIPKGTLYSGSSDEHTLKGIQVNGTMNENLSVMGNKVQQLVSTMMSDFVNGELIDFNSPKYLDSLNKHFYVLEDDDCQYYHLPQQPKNFKKTKIERYDVHDFNKVFVDRVCDMLVRYGLNIDSQTNTLCFNNQFYYSDALFMESASKKALSIQTKAPVKDDFFELSVNGKATSIKITGMDKIVSFFDNIYFQKNSIRSYSLFPTAQEANAFFEANKMHNVFATEYKEPYSKTEVLILCVSKDKLKQQDISYDIAHGVYRIGKREYRIPKELIEDIKSVKLDKMISQRPFISLPIRPELWEHYANLGFYIKKGYKGNKARIVDILKISNVLRFKDAIEKFDKEREDKLNALKKNKEAFFEARAQEMQQSDASKNKKSFNPFASFKGTSKDL